MMRSLATQTILVLRDTYKIYERARTFLLMNGSNVYSTYLRIKYVWNKVFICVPF